MGRISKENAPGDAAGAAAAAVASHEAAGDPHAGYLLESLFDANTVLKADADNTPAALAMAASTILARLAAGGIVAATPAQIKALLAIAYADVAGLGTAAQDTSPLIATQTLASPAASITFSSIPATFAHLELIAQCRSSVAAESDTIQMQLNGDTTASHYDNNGVTRTPVALQGSQNTLNRFSSAATDLPGANATAGIAGMLRATLFNYAATAFEKVVQWVSGYNDAQTASADTCFANMMGLWRSAAAVTSITIAPSTGPNFATGSMASLYGRK